MTSYWDSAANEYANVLTQIAGEPLQELYRRRIAGPIGMNPNAWSCDNPGTVNGLLVNVRAGNLGALRASAREFARIGLLFMNRGAWGATQVVPTEWVDASTAPQPSVKCLQISGIVVAGCVVTHPGSRHGSCADVLWFRPGAIGDLHPNRDWGHP